MLSINTEEVTFPHVPAARSSVVRIKRDILRRSSVGMLATERTPSLTADGTNYVVGADVSLACSGTSKW